MAMAMAKKVTGIELTLNTAEAFYLLDLLRNYLGKNTEPISQAELRGNLYFTLDNALKDVEIKQ